MKEELWWVVIRIEEWRTETKLDMIMKQYKALMNQYKALQDNI